jgi:hypothetical protein
MKYNHFPKPWQNLCFGSQTMVTTGSPVRYEWNDGELMKFTGMNKKQVYIYDVLAKLFSRKGLFESGSLVAEYDTMLSGIQMRRPDIEPV